MCRSLDTSIEGTPVRQELILILRTIYSLNVDIVMLTLPATTYDTATNITLPA